MNFGQPGQESADCVVSGVCYNKYTETRINMSGEKYMKTRIIGTGSCLPGHVVTNDDLSKIMDTSDEWISSRTGIRERCESPGGCWELNLGPLEEQPVLLTAETTLQICP